MLGVETWEIQAAVMMAVVDHHQVAVRSGHKVGKSMLVAILALWWAVCWPDGSVLITAPTAAQVKDVVWKEIRSLAARARNLGLIEIPEAAKAPDTGIRWADGRFIVGRSTDKQENIQGYSGPAMLYLIDEASGVATEIFEALQGNTAGGADHDDSAVAKFVLTGNPTQTSGTFYDAFHRDRGQWRTFRISSAETPNAKAGKVLIRGLATLDYVEKKRRAWGEDSDLYRVRVEGDFPRQGGNSVVPVWLVEQAQDAWRADAVGEAKRLELGVDVARFGDDNSVVAPRHGKHIYPLEVVNGFDQEAVAGLVLATLRKLHRPGDPLPLVKVDAIGVGAAVASILRHHRNKSGNPECEVIGINVAQAANDDEDYFNRRSELWFAIADYLSDGGTLPPDDELAADLVAPTYKFDARGRRQVEKKEDFKKRLGRSPDRADAVALSIYTPGSARVETNLPARPAVRPRWASVGGRGFG